MIGRKDKLLTCAKLNNGAGSSPPFAPRYPPPASTYRYRPAMQPDHSFDRDRYWSRTVRRISILLLIWFIAGPMMGIVFVEQLNAFSLGGVPFGFWMAQQGAIYVFVILIFVNAWLADRVDEEFGVEETADTTQHTSAEH